MYTKECRICYENENENKKKLFSPCVCNGTSKYIHYECLEKWRNKNKTKKPYYYCMECNYKYKFGKKYPEEEFTIFKNRDNNGLDFGICFIINILVIIISALLINIDENLYIPNTFFLGNSTSFSNYLKYNNKKLYLYYYSFTTFCFTVLFHLVFFSFIGVYLKNKLRYLKYIFLPYGLTVLFASHNIYLCLFSSKNHYNLYLYSTGLLSIFNTVEFCYIAHVHDIMIHNLNMKYNKRCVLEYKKYPIKIRSSSLSSISAASSENIIINITNYHSTLTSNSISNPQENLDMFYESSEEEEESEEASEEAEEAEVEEAEVEEAEAEEAEAEEEEEEEEESDTKTESEESEESEDVDDCNYEAVVAV